MRAAEVKLWACPDRLNSFLFQENLMPRLQRLGLITERIAPRYRELGLLD